MLKHQICTICGGGYAAIRVSSSFFHSHCWRIKRNAQLPIKEEEAPPLNPPPIRLLHDQEIEAMRLEDLTARIHMIEDYWNNRRDLLPPEHRELILLKRRRLRLQIWLPET
jgi:hypothetical protein